MEAKRPEDADRYHCKWLESLVFSTERRLIQMQWQFQIDKIKIIFMLPIRFVRQEPAVFVRPSLDLNKSALVRIVAGLFALLGLAAGPVPARISLELHRNIRRVLRPAESAVRRLIVVMAMFVKVKAPPLPRPRSAPAGIVRAGQGIPRNCFLLFDPRQRFFRKRRPKNTPRRQPSITFFSDSGYHRISLAPDPKPPGDGLENSAHIVRRLEALQAALEDLPAQANRLARTLARRQNSPDWKVKLKTPLRPGYPPGHRKKPAQDIDRVLHECEWLARNTLAPDTS